MKKLLLLPVLLLTVGLASGCTKQTTTQSSPATEVSASPSSNEQTFNFTVKNGQVTSPDSFSVTEGTNVVIRVTADVSDEVHLHGYDLKEDVTPTTPAEIRFTAKTAGRFEIELENAKKTLGELTVQPK